MYPNPIIMAPWLPHAKESLAPTNPVSTNSGSYSPSDDFTHDDKETLQSDSFHSEEKPALLKSNTEPSSAVVRKNQNGSPPKSLMTPSISALPRGNGEGHHQNKRKVSTSPYPSVSSSPRRPRIDTSNNNAGKNSAAMTTQANNHFRTKAYAPSGYSPPKITAMALEAASGTPQPPTSPTSVSSSLSATVMDVCKQNKPSDNGQQQQQQRQPRTYYSNHFNADCQTGPLRGGRGRFQHQHLYRGGFHRHGGGVQQMPGDHVPAAPLTFEAKKVASQPANQRERKKMFS